MIRPRRLTAVGRAARVAAVVVALAVLAALVDPGGTQGTPLAVAAGVARSDRPPGPFAVGRVTVQFVDGSRVVKFRGRRPEPRPLETVIWYPAQGQTDAVSARPAKASGPFPLVVFAHGYDSTPAVYEELLEAWARAGYVVAAPIFPLTNANAPGGAKERDIVNQPADMRFVTTRVLAASAARRGVLSGLVDAHAVAVAGQSDGAATALATAYDTRYLDPRIDAAIVLSGAEIMPGDYFIGRNPPLLASQGTADHVNQPKYTYQFFHAAHSPKFLLTLPGARHIGPYTTQQPQLGVVERVTVAFMDRYLKRLPGARARMWLAATGSPQMAKLSNGR